MNFSIKDITYICNSRIPSTEANSIHVMKMCQAFEQEGYRTLLIAPRIRFQKMIREKNELAEHYGIDPVFDFEYRFCIPGLLGRDFAFRVALLCKIRKTSLVYTRYILPAYFCGLFGIPTVFEAHSPPQDDFRLCYFNKFLKTKGFKHLVVISEKLKEIYLAKFNEISESLVTVAHDGIDLERFSDRISSEKAREKLCFPNIFTIGYSGHFYKGRGIDFILEIAKNLPDKQFLIMGGKTETVKEYADKIKDRNIQNVRFTGFVANAKLPIYLSACDLLTMPYTGSATIGGGLDISGWMSPMKMFEYMATGRPILTSDLSVIREVLNSENSFFAKPDNLDDWLLKIKEIESNKALQLKVATKALEDVQAYTWRNRVKSIMKVL